MSSTLGLNALSAISIRLLTPWTGAWIADVDFDLDVSGVVPTGPAVGKIGNASLVGTIDPRGSGRFGGAARARLVAGGGGWDKIVSALHFHNDAGVPMQTVLSATASQVSEKVVVADVSSRLGIDFVRTAGPASRVLTGLPWYVDFAGVTQVAPRLTLPAPPDVEVLSWDPARLVAEIATDSIVVPGTILTDARFDGPQTVRDVEQTFSAQGARATVWCAEASASRLTSALARFVEERSGLAFLKTYRYRIISQAGDGRLTLQAVKKAPSPDLGTISIAFGLPGATSKVKPGAIVLVQFLEGDPTLPRVVGFDDQTPLELKLDALVVKVGSLAVQLAGPGLPVARATDPVLAGPFAGTIVSGSTKVSAG